MRRSQPRAAGRRRRALLHAGLILVAVATLLRATPADAAGPLVSRGKPVMASSTENAAAFPASAAVDGDAGTRWSSAFADAQWLQVDLGARTAIDQVTLRWEAAHARSFRIQVSDDAAAWTTVQSTTTGTGGTQTLAVTGTGRYVRLDLTARATPWGYSLWELEVFGTAPGTDPGPGDGLLSYGGTGAASSFQNDGACPNCSPAKAFDRDPATRWATSATTGWVDPGWISVDLGAPATISRVVLQWDPAFATAYQLQVSDDNATWRTIYSTTSNPGFRNDLQVAGTGRYVRMYGTARSNGYGYSLWEFQVYGTGGAPIAPPPLPPDPTGNQLVWSDEFNGTAGTTPDPAKWVAEVGPGVNNELQYYTNNQNARQDGAGNLVLQARRETVAGSSCPGGPCQYTSGRLNTHGTFEFTYGRVEARIKVSSTQGLWPAFWMLGANFFTGTPWPASGEIDIMEHVGKEPNRTYGTLHAPAYFGAGGYGSPRDFGTRVANDFHTFAVDWNSRRMIFSVDGTPFFTADKATVESTRGPWVYDHPFFIILNNAVGGDWPGSPDGTTVLPQDMAIDYVRVYQ